MALAKESTLLSGCLSFPPVGGSPWKGRLTGDRRPRAAVGVAVLCLVLAVAAGAGSSEASRYVPDAHFGAAGVVNLLPENLGVPSPREVTAVEPAEDGAVYVLYADLPGPGRYDCEVRHQLARYLPNGRLDADFGSGGLVEIAASPIGCRLPSLSVDQKFRPLLVWTSDGARFDETSSTLAVTRFTLAGVPDSGFGGGGAALLRIPCPPNTRASLHGDASGRLTLGFGCREDEFEEAVAVTPLQYHLARLKPNGALDGGFRTVIPVEDGWEVPIVAALEPDGSIVLSQETRFVEDAPKQTRLLRVRPDGVVAARYQARVERSLRRVAELGAPRIPEVATDFALRSGGDLVVSGLADRGSWVISLNRDGTLNHDFNGDGYRRFSPDIPHIAAGLGGDLFLIGVETRNWRIYRLFADGDLDPSVGGPKGQFFLNPSLGLLADIVSLWEGRPLLRFTSLRSCTTQQGCSEPAELRRIHLPGKKKGHQEPRVVGPRSRASSD